MGQLLRGRVDGVRLPSRRSAALLERPAWTFDGRNGGTGSNPTTGAGQTGFLCRYGLIITFLATPGNGCHDDLFGDGRRRFRLRSGL